MKTFNLPDLGEGLADAEIVRWHVNAGDRVKIDDPMLAVETAKAIVEVPSPFSGIIRATHGKPGDTVATGALLVEFEADPAADSGPVMRRNSATDSGAAPAGTPARDSSTVVGRMPASDDDFFAEHGGHSNGSNDVAPQTAHARAVPAARAVARRLGVDLALIRGSGRGGLVTVDDVVNASTAPGHATAPHAAASGRAVPAGRGHAAAATHAAAPTTPNALRAPTPAGLPGDIEQLRGPRRAMAQSMARARDNVMGCTLFDDADLHEWLGDQDITIRLLRAIAEGCAAEPGLNAWFDGDSQTRRMLSHVDVAIAVDTTEGLIVPVIRNVGGRPVADLRRDLDRLKRNTRDRTVSPEDLRDFTFMLSNFGMIAGRYATPVVVPPAVAILGCGRLGHDVIAATSGAVEVHLRMPLSLTFDHRCVTGGEAARFMAALIRDLQKGT